MSATGIIVVGSCNVDLVWHGPRLPERGETVSDGVFTRTFGGKGANQAAAAARLGAHAALVGCVGDDDLGAAARADLEARGVDCRWLHRTADAQTGTAFVLVADGGDNVIAVAPGANRRLPPDTVERAVAEADADVVLVSLEIGLDRAATALAAARRRGQRTVCNPSPVVAGADRLLADCSVVVVNDVEAAAFGGPDAILGHGADEVVVTHGPRGATRAGSRASARVDGFTVEAADTTGAGDAFCAAYAVSHDLAFACAAGALACRAVGARGSQPTRAEVEALLSEQPRSPR